MLFRCFCSLRSQVAKDLLSEFQHPKAVFQRFVNDAYAALESCSVRPDICIKQIENGSERLWHVCISMKWPENFQADGVSVKKSEAEKIAYIRACQKLKKEMREKNIELRLWENGMEGSEEAAFVSESLYGANIDMCPSDIGVLNSKNLPVLPSPVFSVKDVQLKNPKSELLNIFRCLSVKYSNESMKPSFEAHQVSGLLGSSVIWKSLLLLKYPENKIFEGYSARLSDAERISAGKALLWLYEKGVTAEKKHLAFLAKRKKRKPAEPEWPPYVISFPQSSCLKSEMNEILLTFKKNQHKLCAESGEDSQAISAVNGSLQVNQDFPAIQNMFPETSHSVVEKQDKFQRNMQMAHDLMLKKHSTAGKALPVAEKRKEILSLIETNQVVFVSGETGCGKTTQIPQYILDSYISEYRGSDCNIVVTQPRRISAIGIAEYVASQRNEKVGKTVGYQVRLNKILPSVEGSVLFCTTGILLRRLCSDPTLSGVSHVVIDEVHERNVQIDFLLLLLKMLIKKNEKLKLILMSASCDTSLFTNYFNCPSFHVPGFVYPVEEYFLDDAVPHFNHSFDESSYNKLDINLVAQTIKTVDDTKPPGAILCFLPGWNEIKSVYSVLNETLSDENKYMICFLHSRLDPEVQKKVFISPPLGVRKIILATNIAETSITIDDVVYVIDSGLHKETSVDAEKGVTALGTRWVTKANVRQRVGRAGRTRPGFCFHLFPRKVYQEMEEYPVPEILRIPLEKVVLDCKLYCPDVKAEDLLSLTVNPPTRFSIQHGVQELQGLGILAEDENLTELGKTVATFATHPRLSKALVLSVFLRCLDPILTICAFLTLSHHPFTGSIENAALIRKVKKQFDHSSYSDHLALCNLFYEWDSITDEVAQSDFTRQNYLDSDTLILVKQLKQLFTENLQEVHLVDVSYEQRNIYNENSSKLPFIQSVLTSAFYPNVVRRRGESFPGMQSRGYVTYFTLDGHKALIQTDSVVSKESNLPTQWLTYFSAMKSETRQRIMISEVSCIPHACLLMFGSQDVLTRKLSEVMVQHSESDTATIGHSSIKFVGNRMDINLISEWCHFFNSLFLLYLQRRRQGVLFCETVDTMHACAIQLLYKLLTLLEVNVNPENDKICNTKN